MKRVLIPTDFSDNAWNALVYAMDLYRNIPCEFYILNAYDISVVPLLMTISSERIGHLYDISKKESEQGLEQTLKDIKNSKTSIVHSFHVLSELGNVADVMKDVLQSKQIDIVVMGTKGATGAKEVFLGSTAQKVIRDIQYCPILVIPEDAHYKDISEIGFATNFERVYHKAEIDPILELVKVGEGTIRMIEVYKDPKMSFKQRYNSGSLERFFKNVHYEFHVISDFSNVEKAIQALIEELEIDIVALINYEHSFIERLTREPVIKKMVFHTGTPLLIIPADN